jgi:hypothetical protein
MSVPRHTMRSMRSMRGGIIFRNRGPSLKVHHGQCLTRMTKYDTLRKGPGASDCGLVTLKLGFKSFVTETHRLLNR